MKKIIIAALLISTSLFTQAQVGTSFRSGYAFKKQDVFIAPSLNYSHYGFKLGAELMINIKNSSPVQAGFNLSYQYKFFEVGGGSYYEVYSTDAYDSYRNRWVAPVFAALHHKILNAEAFIGYEYLHENRLFIGVKENL